MFTNPEQKSSRLNIHILAIIIFCLSTLQLCTLLLVVNNILHYLQHLKAWENNVHKPRTKDWTYTLWPINYHLLLQIVHAQLYVHFCGLWTIFTTLEKGYGCCFAELPRLRILLYGRAVSVIQVIVAVKNKQEM